MTIDCPPAAAAKAGESVPSASPVGTPQGTGTGSGIDARPSQGAVQHIEGEIKQIDSSRTERAIEVGDAKLWVEPSTAILLNCQNASLADLKPGTPIKAAYEEKDGRKVARVIEARPR